MDKYQLKLALLAGCLLCTNAGSAALSSETSSENPLALPPVGHQELTIISPTVLELSLITTKKPDPAMPETWNFVATNGTARLPAPKAFEVRAGTQQIAVKRVGFKRRVRYAPLRQRDLRIGNYLCLELAQPVPANSIVTVNNPTGELWKGDASFTARFDPLRLGPAVHVNQLGYLPGQRKFAMAGYYLGSLGELPSSSTGAKPGTAGPRAKVGPKFQLVEAGHSNRVVYTGEMRPRADSGFPVTAYQDVWEADFSGFNQSGEYRLMIEGLGASYPFYIGESVAATWARTYARGLYHQRCGAANTLPFTRHVHGPCHLAPADVPTPTNEKAAFFLAQSATEGKRDKRETAPLLTNFNLSLYPFVRQGKVDVSGGHHDAGDYSKYTINSAGLIHILVIAADAFTGVGDLDNLGLPESGDGKGDLLQIAKWEADFLAKLQDTDGGFYFLVYPRERRYENNVLPEQGDPQIVWPKTTSSTAAAVAALAQCASSPRFKRFFPAEAARYLDQAQKGWAFLQQAIAKHGRDGSYQKVLHYGHEFLHDDELAWAACELFLATGDSKYHSELTRNFNPGDANTRRWGWQRLISGYGNAIRSYALAEKSGRFPRQKLDVRFLTLCENELIAAAEDQLRRADDSAYGTSFPVETKRVRAAGWYFSGDAAFDLAAACQLDFPEKKDPRRAYGEALLCNMNYEAGCNPVNVSYVTGLGWRQPREIVHHYAQNDRRVLPPPGISLGNIQGGFMWLDHYKQELGAMSFPPDGDAKNPYPFYDRWGDSFNVSTEFVVLQPARNLAVTAWLLAQTSLASKSGAPIPAQIFITKNPDGSVVASLERPGLDLSGARIIWEAQGHEPMFGQKRTFPAGSAPGWIEAEALLPDGRLAIGVTNLPKSSTAVRR